MDCPKNKGEVMRGSAFNKACRKNPPKKGQITERLQTIPWGDLGVQMVQFQNDFMFSFSLSIFYYPGLTPAFL